MAKQPLISIITVVFNGLDVLPKTITSVIGQSYSRIEYILIDGASTDGTTAYLSSHQDWFSYWVSEPDSGLYDAMNKGLDQANGDFCLFLNAGDAFYSPDSLARMVGL
ncbi:MAG: glycosyltransferase, partial [Bacteroidota bacterium]